MNTSTKPVFILYSSYNLYSILIQTMGQTMGQTKKSPTKPAGDFL
jgi:hypothetical protein